MEFLIDPAKGAISRIVELGVESVLKQFKYMIRHKNISSDLKEKLEELKALKQTLQRWVEAESMKGNDFPPNLSNWISSVAVIEVELQSFYENSVNKNKKCFGGSCSDYALNYSQGKKASAKIERIIRLKEEGSKLSLVSYAKPLPTLGLIFSNDIKSLASRENIIIEVIEKLKDDELKRISICGMAGVGKTTLVKELIKIVENNLFDKVAMAIVSEHPDYDIIQRNIADGLGLVLNAQGTPGRGGEILRKLKEFDDKKVKVLIVLDDVWQELNFEFMGLSSQTHQKGIKILFTSRDVKVCQKMGSQENLYVPVLSKDEGWSLFQEIAGDIVNKHDINPIAIEVANQCGGLPLAIALLASTLRKEEKSSWEDALQQLKNSQSPSPLYTLEHAYSRIEVSFQFLGSKEHKSFLFLCGLYPEDFDISVESLLRHGMGLGLFEANDAVWEIRNHVNSLVNNLKKCFLLLDSKEQGCVKIHDVVRDVILKNLYREEHGIWVQSSAKLKQVKEKKGKWLRMSIILDQDIDLEDNLDCPTLELIQVRTQGKESDIISLPENFIHGMTKLKVVNITNLCSPIISSHFHALINLHTLQLEGCNVGDISVIGKEVKRLEILSFANSKIEELPYEIGNLKFLKLLDLTGCDYLNFISKNVLARLSRLEELYFTMQNFPWLLNKEFVKELRNISSQLKVLEIQLSKVDFLPDDLTFINLKKFWVYVVPSDPYNRLGYLESNKIQLRALDYKSIKSSMMTMQLVKECEILILEEVKELKNVISELDVCGLQSVKDLSLDSCPDLKCVIDCHAPLSALPLIKSLCLKNLISMRAVIQETNNAMIKFSNLEKLELMHLQKLIGFSNSQPFHDGNHSDPVGHTPKLFSFNWMKQFPKLETMLLHDCISIEMVFDLKGYSEPTENAQNILFPLLKTLDISNIDNLLYVWGNVWCSVGGFQNLRFLTISKCNSLKYVITSVIAQAITNLEKLQVTDCEMIENIVIWSRDDKEDANIKENVISNGFGKLCYLSLSNLPNLVSFYLDSVELECPSLKEFEIDNCPMLEISLLPTYIHANQDNRKVTYPFNTQDYSTSSTWSPVGCVSFLPKFTSKRTTDKRINKEASVDGIHSISQVNTKKVKIHMPVLEELRIEKSNLLDVIFSAQEKSDLLVLSHLKDIKIITCDKLKAVMARREEREHMINYFTQLESLHLKDLPNLGTFYLSRDQQHEKDDCVGDHKRISCHPFMDEPLFPNLTYLCIDSCNKINILFSHSSLNSLEHLEILEVLNCHNMQEIVSPQKIEGCSNKITLGKLKHLALYDLPNLKAFCLTSFDFFFPSLQRVEIKYCPNVDVFSQGFSTTPELEKVTIGVTRENDTFKKIYMNGGDINATIRGFKAYVELHGSKMLNWTVLHNEGYLFQNSEMNIKAFHKLSSLVRFNDIKMLQHVTQLNVSKCDSLVEVFESGGNTIERNETTLYELQSVYLSELPMLSHVWNKNISDIVIFHKLINIVVRHCKNLKSLFSLSMAKSLVKLQHLRVEHCEIMEEIITKEDGYIEGGNKFKNLFPKLEVLRLRYLPNLKCICSIDYDYDIPWCTVGEEEINTKIQITFLELKTLVLFHVPKLKCFCSGTFDYNIMVSSIEECRNMGTFPRGNIILNTPNLHEVGSMKPMHTLGDLHLTIYYLLNSVKFEMELGKLETFRDIDEELVGYIKRVSQLCIKNNQNLLNFIPSNMMHILSHTESLSLEKCECLEEMFESNDVGMQYQLQLINLSDLPKLKHIWKNLGQSLAFQRVESITITRCNSLKYVFQDVSVATCLPYLNWISVEECNEIEDIIGNCAQQQQQQKAKKIIFPSLTTIELTKLPILKRFCRSSYPSYVELPKWGFAKLINCPKLNTFWYDGILYTPSFVDIFIDGASFYKVTDVNEVIQEYSKLQ